MTLALRCRRDLLVEDRVAIGFWFSFLVLAARQTHRPAILPMLMFPKNPFTIIGALERCWLFIYQTPADEARRLVPRELELVTRGGCAFWNIVVCRLRSMRPRGFPAFMGVSYWHVAYRFYVRFYPASGPPIEGLYFLRSDCDSRLMTFMGNVLTDFHLHTAEVKVTDEAPLFHLSIHSADAPAQATLDRETRPELLAHSVFPSLEEAAAFLKYKPFGISLDSAHRANVVSIQRDEAAWNSRLLPVVSAEWQFLDGQTVQPEVCCEVDPIPYQWNRGRRYESTLPTERPRKRQEQGRTDFW